MVKTNKNKKGLAEKMAAKSKKAAKLNPFDVRFVKSKQVVLGRKNKNDIGKPGVARAKAIQKRKETLLQEYQLKNKSNMFMDKRIGEKDNNLSAEDKMIARFTAERVKGAGKSSIFNLGDDYNLTHGGARIEDIEKYDDPKSDDDEEQEELLSKQFVDEAHFGGFMSKADDEFKSGKGNTRKEYIENLIRESKKKKAEKRKADEEAEEKTKELDVNWKTLLQRMATFRGNSGEEEKNYDPYDMLVKQMGFEKKEARGGERMKTDEEKVKEERERLQSLEEDRQRRMRGEKVEKKHVSVEDIGEENYKKTEKITQKERRRLLKELLRGEPETEEGDEEGEESEEEGEEEEGEDDDDDDGEDSGDESGEESDKFSDLAESDEEDEPRNEKDTFDKEVEEMIVTASEELPYIIPVPDSYSTLCTLMWGKTPDDQVTVLERILACNHPQLGDHKPALVSYYQFLLQLVQDTALSPDPMPSLSVLFPHIFTLTSFFQQQAATSLLQVISDKYEQFNSLVRARYPGLDTIMFLHLVHILFPTSDYRHPVVTPAITFMCSIMATARPTDRASFSSCLLLCTTMLEYVSLSNRVVPELVNTLHGLIFVSSTSHTTRPPPPCKGGNYLVLSNKVDSEECSKLEVVEVSSVKDLDDNFRVSALKSTLTILIKLVRLYRELPSAAELLEPLVAPLRNIKTEQYPGKVKEMVEQIIQSISSLNRRRVAVVKPARQVPMLRMMEPKVEEGFEPGKKKREGSKEMLEEQKLRHKLKQERKGARKEIRQDTAFLASQKVKEAKLKDDERKEKTKALFSSLANQEGDYKKMLKKKKKF